MIGSTDFPKISHLKKRAFLAAFSRCGSLSKAAKRARVDRLTHYNWLKDDAWHVHAFRQAVIEASDSLQDKLNGNGIRREHHRSHLFAEGTEA